MLRYTKQESQTFVHNSGAKFIFRPANRASKREWLRLNTSLIPASLLKIDPVTKLPTFDFDALPPHVQGLLEMDSDRYAGYLLESVEGVVDESGAPLDVDGWNVDQSTDLLLTACQDDPKMDEWLRRLVAGPEKKSAQVDNGQQLVGAENLPGLPPTESEP